MHLIQTVHLSACQPPLYPLKGLRPSSVKSLFLCLYTCFHMCRSACLLCSQDLAEHLVTHGHRLTAADHKELSSLFNLGQESHRFTVDHHVALAMANLNIPQNWNVLGSHSGNGESRFWFLYYQWHCSFNWTDKQSAVWACCYRRLLLNAGTFYKSD